MVTVTKTLKQYGPDDGEDHVFDTVFSKEGYMNVLDSDLSRDGDYNIAHIMAAQNPRARTSCQGWATEDSETWSDSPTVDPSRSETERYSYGRGPDPSTPGSYGNLDDYSGLVLSQRDFSVASNGMAVSFMTDGSYSLVTDSMSESCDFLIGPLDAESSDVDVYEYPFILDALPVPFSYKNPIDTNVYLRLSHYTSELDPTAVTFYVEGVEQNSSYITITPFYGGLGGLDLLWTNPSQFDYSQRVEVEWQVDDKSDPPNTIIFKYWFIVVDDTVGPRVVSQSPVDDETDVAVNSCITFTLDDYENSVSTSTLELYVNNILIPSSSVTITTNNDGSVVFNYCPATNFLYGDTIPVSIYVEDTEGNYLFHVFTFDTEQSSAPRTVGRVPDATQRDVPIDSDVEVNIVGSGDGVDNTTIVISIDGEDKDNPRVDPVIYRED